jgi:hypothetical protein
MRTMTRTEEPAAGVNSIAPTLLLALELGTRTWKLGFTIGLASGHACGRFLPVRPPGCSTKSRAPKSASSCRGIAGRLLLRGRTRSLLGAPVVYRSRRRQSRYRFIEHRGESALEAREDGSARFGGLAESARAPSTGDRRVWRAVRVPSREEEDARQLHRTRETLQQDRNRLINRLKGL